MTAELTFIPGRVPGIARSHVRPSKAAARRAPAHAAAPMSPPYLQAGMTPAQRGALAALVHTPAWAGEFRYGAARRGSSFAWVAVLACTLAWTMAIAVELAPDLRIAWNIEVPRVAQPHVDARAA